MDNKKMSEYLAVALVIIGLIFLVWEFNTRDVRLCRSILGGMVKGTVSVGKFIDWENLQATGLNVGSVYRRLSTSQNKDNYRDAFIRNFAEGFKYAKGDFNKFVNWRVLERKGTKVIVGADYLLYNKTILFTLSKLPKTRLIAIEWKH